MVALLTFAQGHCCTLHNDERWPTTKDPKNTKALNCGHGALNMTHNVDCDASAQPKHHVNQLVQLAHNSNKPKDKGNNFGKKGHWSEECSNKKSQASHPQSNWKPLRNNPAKAHQGGATVDRKPHPPKKSESQVTKNKLGKTIHWSAKWKRYCIIETHSESRGSQNALCSINSRNYQCFFTK